MSNRVELLEEARKRGLLSRDMEIELEAHKRGLIGGDGEFSAAETIKNIPGSAARYVGDIATAVMNPVDTAKGIGRLAQDVGNKIGRNAAELVHGQEMEPMPEHSEAAADAVGGAMRDRYGSWDAIKNTAQSDPVGMLADVSGLGMASKIPGVARIAAAAEPINLAGKGVRAAAKAAIPSGAAQKLYQSAAKFSTTLKPAERAKIVQTALDSGAMPTSRGVQKVQGRIDILNAGLDDIISTAADQGVKIPTQAVMVHLNELRKSRGGTIAEAADLAAINKIAKQFALANKGKRYMTPDELQKFKVDAYKQINWDAKRMTGTPMKEQTYKAMARGAKDAIVKELPEAQGINKALGELYELAPHLQRAANRIDNRNLLSINTPLNVGAGGVLGSAADATGLGAGVGLAAAALGNPKTKAAVAIVMNKIKQKDVRWLEANMGRAEVRIALALAGRNEDL